MALVRPINAGNIDLRNEVAAPSYQDGSALVPFPLWPHSYHVVPTLPGSSHNVILSLTAAISKTRKMPRRSASRRLMATELPPYLGQPK